MRVLSIVILCGVLSWAVSTSAADLELGKNVYTKKCASCHGADGKGSEKMSKMLKTTIPPLARAAGKPDAELLKLVSEGKKPMPAFGKSLSKDELEAVVQYSKKLGGM